MTESTNGTDMVQLSTESVTVTDVSATHSVTSLNENETVQVTDVTPIETTIRNQGTGVSSISTISESVTIYDFTNATLYETSSEQSTDFASPLITGTTVKLETEIRPDVHTTDQSFSNKSRSFTTSVTSTNPSATHVQNPCHDSTTIAIVASVSAVVVLLVFVISVVCFFRLRHKWRTKIQLERKKTDIWSMATFNNTIINENFNDYQLASTTNDVRKSSAYSENSIRIYDPFSGFAPHTQLSFDNDNVQPTDTLAHEFQLDDSTLRRNTFSAPSGLNTSNKALSKQHSISPNDKRFTSRDRSSTFTVGKKPKTDQHVLLSHEELVEGSTPEHLGALYTAPTHSYYVTEL